MAENSQQFEALKKLVKILAMLQGSNPGHPRDRGEYSPLYCNEVELL